MVREKLQITDSDFEIETSTLKVSLLCPLMKFRINLPGRASTCKHVQCFDLESYLMMNEKKPTWNCPVCDQNAPFDNLLIDSLNQEILAACPRDIEEVVFAQDGSWTKVVPVDTKKSATQSDERSKAKSNEEEVCVEICGKLWPKFVLISVDLLIISLKRRIAQEGAGKAFTGLGSSHCSSQKE